MCLAFCASPKSFVNARERLFKVEILFLKIVNGNQQSDTLICSNIKYLNWRSTRSSEAAKKPRLSSEQLKASVMLTNANNHKSSITGTLNYMIVRGRTLRRNWFSKPTLVSICSSVKIKSTVQKFEWRSCLCIDETNRFLGVIVEVLLSFGFILLHLTQDGFSIIDGNMNTELYPHILEGSVNTFACEVNLVFFFSLKLVK